MLIRCYSQLRFFKMNQFGAFGHLIAHWVGNGLNHAIARRIQSMFHFHGFDDHEDDARRFGGKRLQSNMNGG